MPRKSLTIEQVLTRLAEAPPRIARISDGLRPAQLRATPAGGGGAANDVLAHMRACADVWGDCIAAILAQNQPTLRAINPRIWIHQTGYLLQEFQPSLQAYTAQRSALLAVLVPLPQADWSRSATVTGAGKALVRTVFYYAQWLTRYELTHLKQLALIMNTLRK